MDSTDGKRLIEPNEIRIVACISLKPGRVMIVKGNEIVYAAKRGSDAFVQAMRENPASLGIVAPDVHRLILKHKNKMLRAKAAVEEPLEKLE